MFKKDNLFKRATDICGSAVALVAFSPILVGVGVAVKVKLGGPVIFSQVRPGKDGKPFKMYKFRTMTNALDGDGNLLPDAERMTPFGDFLRSSSLDELPEFLNVLMGDMSLVGPRPLLMDYLDLYTSEQARRHDMRPGITGWAQVNGRNGLTWAEKFEKDVWYVDNWTWLLDVKIMLSTVKKVVSRADISESGQATASRFMGSLND